MLFAVGYLTVFNISTATTRLERVGLAFPVGVVVVTFVMALMDLVRIPLTPAALITADFVLAAALVSALAVRRQKVLEAFKRPIDLNAFNFVWLLLLAFAVCCMAACELNKGLLQREKWRNKRTFPRRSAL